MIRFRQLLCAAGLAACAASFTGGAHGAHHELTPAQAKAREMYETVIAMRTAKGHGAVPEMARYLAHELRGAGFAKKDIDIIEMGETAALVARYRGDGSSGQKPILFLAHMDVVDARREDWAHDPFVLREEDGYFIGRGVADNKYGVVN
ncbi:MAG: M20/M25/M40 family metallo-hydrolase, partial [Hyphococcus sp.]